MHRISFYLRLRRRWHSKKLIAICFFALFLFFTYRFVRLFSVDDFKAETISELANSVPLASMDCLRVTSLEDPKLEDNVRRNLGNRLICTRNESYTLTVSQLYNLRPVMTESEKQLLYKLLSTFHGLSKSFNVPYFIYGGTLLGSYRHFDIIPWDDDIDVMVHIREYRRLQMALRSARPEFDFVEHQQPTKFFAVDSPQAGNQEWKWPFLDIGFISDVNSTHLEEVSSVPKYHFPKSLLFPLHLRLLGKLAVPSPRDAMGMLVHRYKNLTCSSLSFDHKMDAFRSRDLVTRVECRTLDGIVPFVYRAPESGRVREILMKGDGVLRSMLVDEPTNAITDLFV